MLAHLDKNSKKTNTETIASRTILWCVKTEQMRITVQCENRKQEITNTYMYVLVR